MALVKDSYKYHTRLDLVEHIEPGAMQHFGENVIAMLEYLVTEVSAAELQGIKPARETVFLNTLGGNVFIMVNRHIASLYYLAVWILAALFAYKRIRRDRVAGYAICVASIPLSTLAGVLTANTVAAIMVYVLDKPLTYFRREWFGIILYGTPTALGTSPFS